MLKETKIGGFHVLYDAECGMDAPALFSALLAGTASGATPAETPPDGFSALKEMHGSTTGRVFCATLSSGKKLVFKHELRRHHAFDHWVQSFLFGSNTERLIRGLAADGNFGKIPAAQVYLAADRRKWGAVVESFLLIEFVEGEILGRVPGYRERFGNAVAELLARMHALGLVHGDVHERNFVLRKRADGREEVVAIDVSGKRSTPFTRAEDRIRLEWTLGVKNGRRDWGCAIFTAKFRLRNLIRRFRGKPELKIPGR